MGYSNSPLVTYTKISPNRTAPRNHAIDTITPHCFVGQVTAKSGCNASHFVNYDPNNGASCNYVVGKDGSIGLCVPESDRSWCSSNRTNDNRAVTIEVASDNFYPYAVTDAAYEALIKLMADICKRNGIKELKWSTNKTDRVNHLKGCNITVHRDYANKSCPGEYLYSRMGDIAKKVNNILNNEEELDMTTKEFVEKATPEEAYTLFSKAMEFAGNKQIPEGDWQKTGLDWAKENGIMAGNGAGNQMPYKCCTRGEFAAMIMRFWEKFIKKS